MSGGELEDFLHLQEAGLINNPQAASLTLGADLQGLQLPCVTLLPTSPASLKSRTIGSLAEASTALLRARRLMATAAMAIFMPCRQRFERARDRRSTFSSDILARHCQAARLAAAPTQIKVLFVITASPERQGARGASRDEVRRFAVNQKRRFS
jgi:hypothetical protein